MNRRHIKLIYLASLILGICFAPGCKEKVEEPEAVSHEHVDSVLLKTDVFQITSKQFKAAGIELDYVQKTELSETFEVTGELDLPPQNFAEVSTPIGGIIKSINVIEGDYVNKGQKVMDLSTPDLIRLQEDYLTSRSSLEYLEKDYLRQKELNAENVSSGKSYQEAKSKYQIEKARIESLKSQLSLLSISTENLHNGIIVQSISIRSPIKGYIGHVHVGIGSYAEPNNILFDVIDNTHITVHLDVFEEDLNKIKVGQKISVNLPNQDNRQIEGKIYNIGKAMDMESKSVAVHAEIVNNKTKELLPGTFVTALVNVGGQFVDALPEAAVVRAGENEYVFIVADLKKLAEDSIQFKKFTEPHFVRDANGNLIPLTFELIEVKTKASGRGLVEIDDLARIADSSQVVVKGAYYLLSQLKSGETAGCCAPEE
ncbi:MAG: efflux RND transporter periplasmic adaptor subunit [Saprospiraceae bacterium]|nr:efflux RND transporter periplasmic adaptor subunit [Candidatus Opimibacter skivensis]